jgi:hypothetical protein
MGGFFNSARDGDALTLAAGENAAALADFGVVLFRQAQDEAVRVGGLRRVFNIGHARVGAAVGDVGADRVVEQQQRVLQHHADGGGSRFA